MTQAERLGGSRKSAGPARPSAQQNQGVSPAHLSVVSNPNHIDVLDYLTKLAALRDSGALTVDEFQAKLDQLRASLRETVESSAQRRG